MTARSRRRGRARGPRSGSARPRSSRQGRVGRWPPREASHDAALRANVRLLGDILGTRARGAGGRGALPPRGADPAPRPARPRQATSARPARSPRRSGDSTSRRRRSSCARSRSISTSRTSPSSTIASGAGARSSARAARCASRSTRRSSQLETRGCRSRGARREAAARVRVELVLTAHPTEALPRTILEKHRRIAALLDELDDIRLTPGGACCPRAGDRGGGDDPLADGRGPIGAAAGRRRDPPGALVPRGEPLGRRRRARSRRGRRGFPGSPLRFGTWIGGDLDGNPNAGAATVREAVERGAAIVRELLRRDVRELAASWGMSSTLVDADPASRPSTCPESANPTEPYRRRLTSIWERLGADAIDSADELRGELDLVEREPARPRRRAHRRRRARRARAPARRVRADRAVPRRPDPLARRCATIPARVREVLARGRRRAATPRAASDRHADRLDDALGGRRARGRGARGGGGARRRRRAAARDDRRPPRRAGARRGAARPQPARPPRGDGRLLGLGQGRRRRHGAVGDLPGAGGARLARGRARRRADRVPRPRRERRSRRRADTRRDPRPAAARRRRPAQAHRAGRDDRVQVRPARASRGETSRRRSPRRC